MDFPITLLKIPTLLLVFYIFNRGMSPPYQPKEEDVLDEKERSPFTPILVIALTGRVLYLAVVLSESLLVLTHFFPHHALIRDLARSVIWTYYPDLSIAKIHATPEFYVGCAFMLSGMGLRILCFNELGKLFTFVATIQEDHKLVTSGPYAYVRHPSYTGLILTFIGAPLCHLTRGTWTRECGVLSTTVGITAVTVWMTFGLAGIIYTARRAVLEDKALHERFPKEWNSWAGRVRYSLIPGIW